MEFFPKNLLSNWGNLESNSIFCNVCSTLCKHVRLERHSLKYLYHRTIRCTYTFCWIRIEKSTGKNFFQTHRNCIKNTRWTGGIEQWSIRIKKDKTQATEPIRKDKENLHQQVFLFWLSEFIFFNCYSFTNQYHW